MNYSVIIPNRNGSVWLWRCLSSIDENRKWFRGEIETILVDNGSTDGSKELFLKWGKGRLIENSMNLGFAKAVNLGISEAKYPWVAVVNNDLFLDRYWFLEISLAIESTNGGVFGGTVADYKGDKLESRGLEFDRKGRCWNLGNREKYKWNKLKKLTPKKVWGISGAAVVYNKDIYQKYGGLDEDFFAYEEDMDLAWRFNALGVESYWVPRAVSFHLGGATSKTMGNLRSRLDNRNWIWFLVKNYSRKEILGNWKNIMEERMRNIGYLIKDTVRVYKLRAIWYLPWSLVWLAGSTIDGLPKMIKKHQQMKRLLQSIKG